LFYFIFSLFFFRNNINNINNINNNNVNAYLDLFADDFEKAKPKTVIASKPKSASQNPAPPKPKSMPIRSSEPWKIGDDEKKKKISITRRNCRKRTKDDRIWVDMDLKKKAKPKSKVVFEKTTTEKKTVETKTFIDLSQDQIDEEPNSPSYSPSDTPTRHHPDWPNSPSYSPSDSPYNIQPTYTPINPTYTETSPTYIPTDYIATEYSSDSEDDDIKTNWKFSCSVTLEENPEAYFRYLSGALSECPKFNKMIAYLNVTDFNPDNPVIEYFGGCCMCGLMATEIPDWACFSLKCGHVYFCMECINVTNLETLDILEQKSSFKCYTCSIETPKQIYSYPKKN
jgi:hypothetical protein